MSTALFTSLCSQGIAVCISRARRRVCYAAPGIHDEAAAALAALKVAHPGVTITVSLDFDERTLRMGYGSLSAVEKLRMAGMEPTHSPGFRAAVLIVDDEGWVFTPTALYLETEPQSDETPNAIHLAAEQVRQILVRLSPAARKEAIAAAKTPEEAAGLEAIPLEVGEEMQRNLKPKDYEPTKTKPGERRWENTTRWARQKMVDDGRLMGRSPKGVWEISEKGKAWLKTQ